LFGFVGCGLFVDRVVSFRVLSFYLLCLVPFLVASPWNPSKNESSTFPRCNLPRHKTARPRLPHCIALHRIACRLASAVAAARDEHAGECGALKQPPAGGRVVHLSDRALLQGRGGVPHATTRGGARGAFVSVHDRGQETVRHPGGRGQFGRDGPGQVPFEVGQQQFAQGLGEHGAAYCLGPVRSG